MCRFATGREPPLTRPRPSGEVPGVRLSVILLHIEVWPQLSPRSYEPLIELGNETRLVYKVQRLYNVGFGTENFNIIINSYQPRHFLVEIPMLA
jgi:hypothetical protein